MLQAGWISTLLPIRANWIAVRAPTLQSRPILTSAPMTAPAPMTVPAPISTLGPITASGSTMTPSSRWADGSMMADGAMPSLSNQDCGRSASACHSRASLTKARNGCAARNTATWVGTRPSKRALTSTAPALVALSWSAYLRLSKNARCIGPASSSEASPLITRSPRAGSANTAPVNAARSASVDEAGCLKNIGCAIPPVAVRPVTSERRLRRNGTGLFFCPEAFPLREPEVRRFRPPLERCATAKLELLHAVKLTLRKRHRIVEAQRTERRSPDDADTHLAADHVAIVRLQSQAGSGQSASRIRRLRRLDTAGHVDFARCRPRRRALVVPETAGVGIDRALESDFLRQEPERHLQFERSAPVLGAAERVTRTEGIDVARTDAVRSKAANQVRTHLEVIEHAQFAATELVQHAALEVDQADDIGNQRGVVLRVDRRLDVLHVAADTGEVLLPVDQQAVGRVLVVVQRVVVQRVTDRRGQRLAALQFPADRQRGFAVAVAPQAGAGGVDRWRR